MDAGATTPAARACPLPCTHPLVCRALGPCGSVSVSGAWPEQRSSCGGGWTLSGMRSVCSRRPCWCPRVPAGLLMRPQAQWWCSTLVLLQVLLSLGAMCCQCRQVDLTPERVSRAAGSHGRCGGAQGKTLDKFLLHPLTCKLCVCGWHIFLFPRSEIPKVLCPAKGLYRL